ncbi:MAG: serine hydrolase [Pseudomonadota bacterium]|nr:serine hydrolase [Pseudomonadota bacterium]
MRLHRRIASWALVLAMSACAGSSQAPPVSGWRADIDALVAPFQGTDMPGVAVAVIKDGGVLYARAAGMAQIETGEHIDGGSSFRLASLSKHFTAAAISMLVREGRLRLDERLVDVFPDFPDYGRSISIDHLLHHRAGLRDYEDLMDANRSTQISDAEILAISKAQDGTLFAPGSAFGYSNTGYVLLGLIVEQRSAMPLNDYLVSRLFQPAGMRSSVMQGSGPIPNRVYGYGVADGRARLSDQSNTSATGGDGGIYASLDDMTAWLIALDGDEVLDAAQREAMFRAVPIESAPGVGYGQGWFIDHANGHLRQWHSGESRGFRHKLLRFPGRGLAVLVLSNMNRADEPALQLADEIAGVVDPALKLKPGSVPPPPPIN